ncbi:MAG: ABC transporter substrate-binding protein, partial [Geobacteraceae bacterium]|nr:ABC transporter substrate-binding protein [Geobacteraceae bacterium]
MLRVVILMALFWFSFGSTASSRMIVDMDGRPVEVPVKISRIYGVSPPVTSILYAMDPSLLVGW